MAHLKEIVLGITLVLTNVIALLGISFFVSACNNPAPVQTGAEALPQAIETAPPTGPTLSETVVPASTQPPEPTYEFVLGYPPEVTPFPTFDPLFIPTIAPRSDWLMYQDDLEGFSIEYPQGWYIKELPQDTRQNAIGYATHISNHDPANPALVDLKGRIPPSLFRLDIIVNKPGATGIPLQPGQTLEEWMQIYQDLPQDMQVVEQHNVTIRGAQALIRSWQRPGQPIWTTLWIVKNDRVFALEYWLYPQSVTLSQTAEQIIESFRFTR